MADRNLEHEIERMLEALGYELVELERAGSRARPILRMRVDRPGSEPGQGVTVEDCARVSRALSAELDERGDLSPTYVLEVSSPGVERPLTRSKDFERFAGEEVAVQGKGVLAGRARRLEGVLLGLRTSDRGELVALKLADGAEVEIPRAEIQRVHLVYKDVRLKGRTNSRGGKPDASE